MLPGCRALRDSAIPNKASILPRNRSIPLTATVLTVVRTVVFTEPQQLFLQNDGFVAEGNAQLADDAVEVDAEVVGQAKGLARAQLDEDL